MTDHRGFSERWASVAEHAHPKPIEAPTHPSKTARSGESSLLGKLVHSIRPEFRGDVIFLDGPQFNPGRPKCEVLNCTRMTTRPHLCRGHNFLWRKNGKPDLDDWVRDPHPLQGSSPVASCRVESCRESRGGGAGLCTQHGRAWKRAGKPLVEEWAETATTDVARQQRKPICALQYCTLVSHSEKPERPQLCKTHLSRWENRGKPDLETFINTANHYGVGTLRFGTLPARLKLELQYGLQQMVDAQTHQVEDRLQSAISWLASSETKTLMQHSANDWTDVLRGEAVNPYSVAFIRYAAWEVDALQNPKGWEHEYDRDVWDIRRLGLDPGTGAWRNLRFDRIHPLWLRQHAKRYLKLRVSTDTSTSYIYRCVRAMELLSDSLVRHGNDGLSSNEFSRQHLEDFLADLKLLEKNPRSRRGLIGCVNMFLLAIRKHGWEPVIDISAALYREDYPKPPISAPRAVDESVMAQIEDEVNLGKLKHHHDRLIIKIVIECGRRIGEVTSLRADCLQRDRTSGEPYLRYWNRKMKREAHCPISEELAIELERAVAKSRLKWPKGNIAVFPSPMRNPEGLKCINQGAFRERLYAWLELCSITNPDSGEIAHITPHQWRHTFAVRLVDSDVPLTVIARLLDHDSLTMTQHYARVSDRKARQEWQRARKVDANGKEVSLLPDEELADAAYVKHRLTQSRHALPNGYCRLASQNSCQHLNPCLSCPLFITTPVFLPELKRHRSEVEEHLALNLSAGRSRPAEKDAQDLERLDSIITSLEEPGAEAATGVSTDE